jgi:hypothetical protein
VLTRRVRTKLVGPIPEGFKPGMSLAEQRAAEKAQWAWQRRAYSPEVTKEVLKARKLADATALASGMVVVPAGAGMAAGAAA